MAELLYLANKTLRSAWRARPIADRKLLLNKLISFPYKCRTSHNSFRCLLLTSFNKAYVFLLYVVSFSAIL